MRTDDVAAAYGLGGRPFPVVVVALFLIVLLRAQGTYWLGRGIAAGTVRLGADRFLTGPRAARAIQQINRWGAPTVTLSFLTVGFQTAINGAAGLTRMSWLRYSLAMVPGCIAWAFIWGTVGLGAIYAAIALAARSPWFLATAVVALVAVIGTLELRRRRRRAAEVVLALGTRH